MNKGDLIIDGALMPRLKLSGLTITREKIWSKNTGRSASGVMVGDIVRIPYKLQCEWPPLTAEEVKALDAAVSKAFFSVQFWDPSTNGPKTITAYAGTLTLPVYSYVNGVKTYSGVKVDLIER